MTTKLILVVEDAPELRADIGSMLAQRGFSTVLTADGREALIQLRSGLKADLILLDLVMPGMGGLEFREEQLHDPAIASIPVIVMTAVSRIDTKDLKLTHVLMKPFSPEHLLAAIAAAQE